MKANLCNCHKAHGIMFHHFHDDQNHIVSQGSISAEKLDDLLVYYGKEHNLIGADEFLYKANKDKLDCRDVCLTFDDGLLCQYDIALPVLEDHKLTAFWFVYTSPLDGIKERIEIYRDFRFSVFSDIEQFYSVFFNIAAINRPEKIDKLKDFDPNEYLKDYPFYTENDKRFRFVRDTLLEEAEYFLIMDKMIEKYEYDVDLNAKKLWLNSDNIKLLYERGNVIGLHSYSHPTVMEQKDYSEQYEEYSKNKRQIEMITGGDVVAVSYPCNSYNNDTLRCMKQLKIQIGFRANTLNECLEDHHLELPREDHSNIIKDMEGAK